MSKELEAFNRLMEESPEVHIESYNLVHTALQRLESIDNVNPSEALKSLEKVWNFNYPINVMGFVEFIKIGTRCFDDMNTIKQALIKAQELEKILNIIFEKGFDRSIKDYDDYNIWVEYKVEQFAKSIEKNPTILNWDMFDNLTYTQEEFNLLKQFFEKKYSKVMIKR